MKAKKVLKLLQVTRPTLCSYVRKGYIKTFVMPSGRYEYDDNSVYEFMGIKNRDVAIYSRVPVNDPIKLDEQLKHCNDYAASRNYNVTKTYSEIACGYDIDRKGFLDLLHEVTEYKIRTLIIACKEALVTTGFNAWADIFKENGCEIMIADGYEMPEGSAQIEIDKFVNEMN